MAIPASQPGQPAQPAQPASLPGQISPASPACHTDQPASPVCQARSAMEQNQVSGADTLLTHCSALLCLCSAAILVPSFALQEAILFFRLWHHRHEQNSIASCRACHQVDCIRLLAHLAPVQRFSPRTTPRKASSPSIPDY